MLNYISAECYKFCRKKGLIFGMVLLLALESLALLAMRGADEVAGGMAYLFLLVMLPFGLVLAPVFAAVVFDDQYRNGTLKNEVTFGIPRTRIYLGKLAAAILMGTMVGAAVVGWYLLLSQIFCAPDGMQVLTLTAVLADVACALPLWIASLSGSFLLLMVLHSASGAMALTYLICMFGTPVALVGASADSPLALRLFDAIFYAAPFRALYGYDDGVIQKVATGDLAWLYCWSLGIGWVVVTAAVGLSVFHRREIR